MGLLHSKLKFCGAEEAHDMSLISAIINSNDRNEFLTYIEKLLYCKNFELPKRYLKLIRPKVKIQLMEMTERIRWIEELKSCIIEFYKIKSYPVENRSQLPYEIRIFEKIGVFMKDLFWEITTEKGSLSAELSAPTGIGSLLNFAPERFKTSSKNDELIHFLTDEELINISEKITTEITDESLKLDDDDEVSELQNQVKLVSVHVNGEQQDKSMVSNLYNDSKQKPEQASTLIDDSEEQASYLLDKKAIEDQKTLYPILDYEEENLTPFFKEKSSDEYLLEAEEEGSGDSIVYTNIQDDTFECSTEMLTSVFETNTTSVSSVDIEHVDGGGVITTSLPNKLNNFIDLNYSKLNPISSLTDKNSVSCELTFGNDEVSENADETAETIRLYKMRFKDATSSINTTKKETILDRPKSYKFGESPVVKNFIRSVVRIQIYDYFDHDIYSEYEKKTLQDKLDLIETNENDLASNFIKQNPRLIEIAAKSWVTDFDQLYQFYQTFLSLDHIKQEWLQFEKSFIPSTISKVIGYVTFLQLVELKDPKIEFLDHKIVEPILSAIIKQLQHPLYHKNYESYCVPSNLKKLVPEENIPKTPEGLLIDMGIIKTSDERLDTEKFAQKFVNAVVFENILYEENTYWHITYSEKILTLFKISDQILDDILDDCIQEILEYLQPTDPFQLL